MKCYIDKLTIIPKVQFVWLIDYFFVLLIDSYDSNQFLRDNGIDAVPTQDSPLTKLIEELPFDEKPKTSNKTN